MRAFRTGPLLMELLEKRWIRLATLDPDSGEIHVHRNGLFERSTQSDVPLPSAPKSSVWYAGESGYLPIATIGEELVNVERH